MITGSKTPSGANSMCQEQREEAAVIRRQVTEPILEYALMVREERFEVLEALICARHMAPGWNEGALFVHRVAAEEIRRAVSEYGDIDDEFPTLLRATHTFLQAGGYEYAAPGKWTICNPRAARLTE